MPFPHALSQSLSPAKGTGNRPNATALGASVMSRTAGQAPVYCGGPSPAGAANCHPIFAAEAEVAQNPSFAGNVTPQQRMLPGSQDVPSVKAEAFYGASPPQPLMESHFSTPQQHPPMMPVNRPEASHMPVGSSAALQRDRGSAFVQVSPSCHARGVQYPAQHSSSQMPQYHPSSGQAHHFQAAHPAAGPSPPTYMPQEPASHQLSQPPAASPAPGHPASIAVHSILGNSPSPVLDSHAPSPDSDLLLSALRAPSLLSPRPGSHPQPTSATQSLASPDPALNSVQASPHPIVGTPEPTSERSRSIVTSSEELRSGAGGNRKRGREFGISASAEDGYSWLKYGEKRLTSARRTRAYFRCSKSKDFDCPAKKFIDLLEGGGEGSNAMITYIQTHNHDKDPRKQVSSTPQADPLKSGTLTPRPSHISSQGDDHRKPKGGSAFSPLQPGNTAGQGIIPKNIMEPVPGSVPGPVSGPLKPALPRVGTPGASPSPVNMLSGASLSLRPPTPMPTAALKAHPLVSEEEPPMMLRR